MAIQKANKPRCEIKYTDILRMCHHFANPYPLSAYQEWLYRRQILNPKHTKYRAYLRGAR